jgi:hypothetical protein
VKHPPRRAWRPLAVALALLSPSACDGTAGPAGDAPLDPRLEATLAATGSAEALVLLDRRALDELAATDSFGRLDADGRLAVMAGALDRIKDRVLARNPLTTLDRYRQLPVLHVRAGSKEVLGALAADPDVVRVAPDESYTMTETVPANLSLINQPQAAAAGGLGEGAAVVVLDSGTDYTRAPFDCTEPGPGCKVVYAADLAPEDHQPDDEIMHGTNVSGIILAVAPAARIIAFDVFDGKNGLGSAILSGIDWSITNRSKYGIVALNMSFGGGSYSKACTADVLGAAIATARAAGILSAVASGNEGKTDALSSPACAPSAVSVGAVYPRNVGGLATSICTDSTSAADQVACFSNSAPFLTMLAPGVAITAAGITMTGTSQATPHVAGAIAVLRATHPDESVTDTVARLTGHGVAVTDGRNGLDKPRLDLAAALTAPAMPPPGPTGTLVLAGGAPFTRTPQVTAAVPTTSGVAAAVCLSTGASCTAWLPWAATVPFTLPAGDGPRTVRAWWMNAEGSVSATPALATITLDATAPADGNLAVQLSGDAATFTWSGFSDAGAGLASYRLMLDSGPVAPRCRSGMIAAAGTMTGLRRTLPAGTSYRARLCAIDRAGNTSAGSERAFTVPTAGPTGRLVLAGGAAVAHTTLVAATVTTTGGVAADVCLSSGTTCTAWRAWAPTVWFTLPPGNGPKIVRAWWRDRHGDASATPATARITLDAPGPPR